MMWMPLEIPWSVKTDKNGNAQHTENLGQDGWYNLAISGQSSGNAYWALSRNLSFLRPGFGSQIHMPVGITPPGSRIDINVIAGPQNAVVSGLLYGQKAKAPQYLTDIGGLDDYASNSLLGTGQTLLGTIQTPGDGLPHTVTFPVQSSSTQAIGWDLSLAGSNLIPASLKITGDVTNASPVNISGTSGFTFASGVGRWQLPDQNAICTVTDDGIHPTLVYFLAYNFEPIMNVRVGAGDPPLSVTAKAAASKPPYDWNAQNTFINPTTPSIVSSSPGTRFITVDSIIAILSAIGQKDCGIVQLTAAGTTSGQVLARITLALSTVTSATMGSGVAIYSQADLGYTNGASGDTVTLSALTGGVVAGCRVDLTMGGYIF